MQSADVESIVEKQWSMLLGLQEQARQYPSLENLEKLTECLKGYKELLLCLSIMGSFAKEH